MQIQTIKFFIEHPAVTTVACVLLLQQLNFSFNSGFLTGLYACTLFNLNETVKEFENKTKELAFKLYKSYENVQIQQLNPKQYIWNSSINNNDNNNDLKTINGSSGIIDELKNVIQTSVAEPIQIDPNILNDN